jgi:arylsulfatase A-like enzyme/Flp pilus assembly protein TadD
MKNKLTPGNFAAVCFILVSIFLMYPLSGYTRKQISRLNVLLITIDTLRVDRLSFYDSKHLQTPNIDKFAKKGMVFFKAFAHTSTTLPSHANILCGTTPLYHGVHDNFNFILDEEFLTLAEYLKSFGYNTGAFVGGFPLDSRFGLSQGFDVYDDNFGKELENEIRAEFVISKALAWLGLQKSPWFLWVHCYDPHDPYSPPEPFRKQYREALYDGEVAYVDAALDKLFNFLEKNNLFENTIIILTGDHGEALGDHGEVHHGFFAYNEVLWIPLIIYSPGIKNGCNDQYVSHIDIFPTICDLIGIKKLSHFQGISLASLLDGKKTPQRYIYFESLYPHHSLGWAPLKGFIEKEEKYINSPISEFYNLKNDFGELNNLAKEKKLDIYKRRLDRIIEERSNPEEFGRRKKIDPEALRRLASLGYVANPNLSEEERLGPKDDIKTLLPFYNRAYWTMTRYQNGEMSLDKAVEILKDVLNETQKVDIAFKGLASLCKESGRLEEAIGVLKSGFEHNPSSYEVLRDLMLCLSEVGQHDDAISLSESIHLVQMDFSVDIWNVLGHAYWKKGDLEMARKTYEKALSIDSENPSLLTNYGNVCLSTFHKTNRWSFHEKAIELFKRAVELDPNNAHAYSGLGTANLVLRDLDAAINDWKKVLEILPSHADSAYNIARAYLAKGNRQKALDLLQQYMGTYSDRLSPAEKQRFNELMQKCKK